MNTTRKWLVAVPTAALLVGGLAAGAQAVSTTESRPPAGYTTTVGDHDCDRVRDLARQSGQAGGQIGDRNGCRFDCDNPGVHTGDLRDGSGRDGDQHRYRSDAGHRDMDRYGWQRTMHW